MFQDQRLEPDPEIDISEAGAARLAITQRLSDIITWPSTRIAPHERQLAGDLLVGLLRVCPIDVRRKCALKLSSIMEAPKGVLRYLARDEIAVASILLLESKSLDDVDLIDTIRAATPAHVEAIAQRKQVSEAVSEAIVRRGEIGPIATLLQNGGARFAQSTLNTVVRISREHRKIVGLVARREELKPTQGLTLFWWSGRDTRAALLRRFAVDRTTLIAEMAEFFPLSNTDAMADPEVRKALQFVERRQRSRKAAEVSAAGTVEKLIETILAQGGLSRDLVGEFAHLCGLRPAAAARILTDSSGEAVAVLAKAIGLKREPFTMLWRATRPADDAGFEAVLVAYETLSASKAQTVLRYWNWGLTADTALAPEPNGDADLDFTPARRFFSLVRSQDL